jgi:histidine triad (HIT) family protein
MSEECQVCAKHKTGNSLPGGEIFKDASIFIAHFPIVNGEKAHQGHIILEMTRHLTKLSELNEVEAMAVGKWTPKIAEALEETLKAEHVYMVRIGDITPHLHFHFIPRYANTPKDLWGPLLYTHPQGAPRVGPNEMIKITNKIKSYLDQKV